MNLALFKQHIDEIAAINTASNPYIRFQVNPDQAFPRTDLSSSVIDCDPSTPINCSPSSLSIYTQAIDYANSKSVDVFLIVVVPYWAKYYSPVINTWETSYTLAQYKTVSESFLDEVFTLWSGKVDVWQVFNEANKHAFDSYADVDFSTNLTYETKATQVLTHIGSYLSTNYPLETITINVGGWPLNDAVIVKMKYFFDAVHADFDDISVDFYPDDDPVIIDKISDYVVDFVTTYSKDVHIAEIGMCVDTVRFNEADQANYLPQYLDEGTVGGATSVILYQYQDNPNFTPPCEDKFGIKRADGTQRPAYQAVINYIT